MAAPGTVHRDFTVRRVLVSPAGLGVVDWDGTAPGPVEKDLASVLAGLSRAGGSSERLLAAYEDATGRVDHQLLGLLLSAHREVRALRRVLPDVDRPTAESSARRHV